ncbi:14735_t:CDS:2 [Rhizophagus irregularis]|nr:14735_t:CDS:2 [Rhizophagus irregularis]
MTHNEYLIGTCFSCKKCLYCGAELSIQKKMCLCDKTIKPHKNNRTDKVRNVFSRILKPDLPPKQLEYIQEKINYFKYSINFNTEFKFSFYSACNSAFQRKKSKTALKASTSHNVDIELENNLENNISIDLDEKSEAEQIISFNLMIKSSTGPTLPSKWVEIEASSLDDILACVHQYVVKLTGDKEIMHSDYLVSYKPEKAEGVGTQLMDAQDYKKFLLDYKKLLDKKKNIISDSEESNDEEVSVHKRKNAVPKVDDFSAILQQEGLIIHELREQYKCNQHGASCFVDDKRYIKLTAMHFQCWAKEIIRGTTDNTQVPNLPIFSRSNSVKEKPKVSTPMVSNSDHNTAPIFFAFPSQMIQSFVQNPTTSSLPNNVLSFSRQQPVPSLDEFFDELSSKNEEFLRFKSTFEDEQITVDQICDLTDAEFDQLGINKIGWRKAFRAAAQRYHQ